VVDDEDVVRSAVAALLDGYASDVQQCDSVNSAVCCLADHAFDVVICDMRMPKAHGLELIKKIREQQQDVAFVVMTDRPELPDVITALRLQAAGFLEKPFSEAELVDALDTAYGEVRSHRRIAERLTVLNFEVEKKSKELQEALANLVINERSSREALVAALDAREHETCAHSFRGYPDHLRGENIPLGARLFTVADTLDALMSDRCYRPATSLVNAQKEIICCTGTQFDPAAVETFLRIPEEQWLKLRVTAELAYHSLANVDRVGCAEAPESPSRIPA
jgi:response regulator RpfG family c-di-GMP phosphodiesterase